MQGPDRPWESGTPSARLLSPFEPQFTCIKRGGSDLEIAQEPGRSFSECGPKPPLPTGCLLEMQLPGLRRDLLHHNLKECGWEESGFLTSCSGDLDDHGI